MFAIFTRSLSARLAGVGAAALMALSAGLAPAPAEAREFQKVSIELDLGTGEFDANVESSAYTGPIQSPAQIINGVFTELELRVVMRTPAIAEGLKRKLESGFTDEPSGCTAGNYGPLDMEDGLRYFLDVQTTEGQVIASFYPGNRSTHWANDAFCEFDESVGPGGAVFRLSGYYYVIHRQVENALSIQLRAVTLTPEETNALQ